MNNNPLNFLYKSFVPLENYKLLQFVCENFFKDKIAGYFIEIGANDGMGATKFFEDLGWQGIAIEPIPDLCERIKKERTTKCIQGCIASKKMKSKFLKINPPGPACLSGIVDHYDPRHVQRIKMELESDGGSTELIEMECYLFNDVMSENGFSRIDYLSVDTEGGELNILKSIDFDKYYIDVICVENNYLDVNLPAFLISKGYCFVLRTGPDEIYKKLNFPS